MDELVAFCRKGPRHVVLTGGEPLLFENIAELSNRLRAAGHHVTVETAGTVDLPDLQCDLASISPKLAHSTPHERDAAWARKHETLRHRPAIVRALMRFPWQLKYVVRAYDDELLRADVDEVLTQLEELAVSERERVLLMPECIDRDRLRTDYAALLPHLRRHGFRLGPRLHIEIFGHTPGT